MPLDLRALLAEAYRDAALKGADMPMATRAFEAIRAAATGPDPVFAALHELQRQNGRATEPPLVAALVALFVSIEEARVAEDLDVIRKEIERDPEAGWVEFRRRFARALGEFKEDIAERIGRAELPLTIDQRSSVERWVEQVRFAQREEWAKVLDLFEPLGSDPVIDPPDRARFFARATQVHLYFTQNRETAERTLAAARDLVSPEIAVSQSARAEVTCVEGQFEMMWGDRARAKQYFEEAIGLDPSFEDAYRYMGDWFADQDSAGPGELEEAERWYESGIENAPGGTLNIVALARLLGRPERYAARRLRLAELRQHALRVTLKRRYSLYLTFAGISIDNKEFDEAERLVEQAIAEDPARQDAWVTAARIRIERGDPIAAIASLGGGFAADHEGFVGWGDLAVAAATKQAQDNPDAVLLAIEKAFGAAPSSKLVDVRIDLLQAAGRWEDAEAASQAVSSVDGDLAAHRRRLSLIHNAHGTHSFERGDYADAIAWYEKALAEASDDAVMWSNLSLALENDTAADGRVERLGRAVDALERAIAAAGDTGDPEYSRRRDALAAKHRLASVYGAPVLDYPVITPPLGLDVGSALLSLVVVPGTSSLSDACLAAVAAVRARVSRESGLTLPGINFRELSDAEEGQYVTLVGGIAVAQGSVPPDRRLLFGAAAPPGSPPDLPPAFDPLSREVGYWITESDLDRVDGDYRAWNALEFALHELAHVYLQNVRTELTLDDVAILLRSASVRDADALVADTATLQRITHVIRCLVSEGAPATELDDLAPLVRESPEDTVTFLVERARMLPGIRESLPGNRGGSGGSAVEIGPTLSTMVRKAIWRGDSEPALAIKPEECQEFLAAVREALTERGEPHLVVTDDDLRPFVRWMLEIEFPAVPVLARRELLSDLEHSSVADKVAALAGVGG